jgi:hypothetical protein
MDAQSPGGMLAGALRRPGSSNPFGAGGGGGTGLGDPGNSGLRKMLGMPPAQSMGGRQSMRNDLFSI